MFHLAGHWDADGSQMVEAIQRVVVRPTGRKPRVAAFPWWLLTLASPFVATFREIREMRYLWHEPVRMGSARLIAALHEPHTPLEVALEATLVGLGCLAASASSAARALAQASRGSSVTEPVVHLSIDLPRVIPVKAVKGKAVVDEQVLVGDVQDCQ
jgi:hypothetical protein